MENYTQIYGDFLKYCKSFPSPEADSSPLKINGGKMDFISGKRPIFAGTNLLLLSGEVIFRISPFARIFHGKQWFFSLLTAEDLKAENILFQDRGPGHATFFPRQEMGNRFVNLITQKI